MPIGRRALVFSVVALGLVGLVVAIVSFALPFEPKKEVPDWAAVWTMRWTAIGSVAAVSSMVAIIVTAFYAARAIDATKAIEKSKRTAQLIATYYDRKVVDSQFRAMAAATGASAINYLAEFHIIAGFLEECAVTFFAGLVDKEMFLDALDYAVNNAWLVVHYILVAEIERDGTWTDTSMSDKLRRVCFDHLEQRLPPKAREKLKLEEENVQRFSRARSAMSTDGRGIGVNR